MLAPSELMLSSLEAWRQSSLIVNIFTTVLGLATLLWTATVIHSVFFHPLSAYPGPKIAAASRLPYWHACLNGNSVRWFQQLHRRYGPVVRYSPYELSYTGTQAWRDVYGAKGKNENPKDLKFYTAPKNGSPPLVMLDSEEHPRVRRLLAPGFSDRALKQQEYLFQQYSDLMISKIREAVDKNADGSVDMVKMYNLATFDIMAELTFGESLGVLDNSEYNPWIDLIFKSLSMLPIVQITEYYPVLQRLYELLEPKSLARLRSSHFKYCTDRLDKRLAVGSQHPDIWNLVLSEEGDKLTVPQMQSNAELFMTAGTETTATALSGLTYLLLRNPDKMQTLVHEIRTSFVSNAAIDFESLPKLSYLNACIEEGLRLYPPVPSGLLRITPEGGNVIMGRWVPPGISVSVHTTSTYRDPKNFREPDSFVPERWLGDPRYKDDARDARQPFSIGPRNCLGVGMAWHEIRLLLAKVLFNFDIEIYDESEDWFDQKVFVLWQKRPLACRMKPVT
ncbi:cytochrome P450 [Biscogniauxia sp. FL1348]|nr:cytochrome P450 [Biscogniauxia sp. FL1348]